VRSFTYVVGQVTLRDLIWQIYGKYLIWQELEQICQPSADIHVVRSSVTTVQC